MKPPEPQAPVVLVPQRSSGRLSQVERVEAALEAAGQADSWEAGVALDLAERLDTEGMSGSARAAVARELRAVMGEALRGTVDTRSAVGRKRDELARRREQRAGGAG